MGTNSTKFLSTFSSSLGGIGGKTHKRETKKSNPEGWTLLHGRSNSLDSISTALTIEMEPQTRSLSKCSSLDSLLLLGGSHPLNKIQRRRKVSGKQYLLLDNESVVSIRECLKEDQGTSRCAESVDNGKRSLKNDKLSSSLPIILACSTGHGSMASGKHAEACQGEVDEFSDRFVMATSENDLTGIVSADKYSKAPPLLRNPASQEVPTKICSANLNIPPALLNKLSQEEWEEVINFACVALGQSLQSSIKEKVITPTSSVHDEKTPNTLNKDDFSRQATLHEDESKHDREVISDLVPTYKNYKERQESKRERKQRARKDRPNSLPPVYLKSKVAYHSKEIDATDGLNGGQSLQRERSRSYEGNFNHKCTSMETELKREGLTHYPCSSRTRRRRTSKSGNKTLNPPVDVSLDDNCPGVTRVRRLHRHKQHHSFCNPSLHKSRSDGSCEKQSRIREQTSQKYSINKDDHLPLKQSHSYCTHSDTGKDQSFYVTLDDMRVAASLLKKSEERAEMNLAGSHSNQRTQKLRQNSSQKSGQSSSEEEKLTVIDMSTEQSNVCNEIYSESWNELVFPESTRSGRDSPATDMAVISLDLNSPFMLKQEASEKMPHRPPGNAQMYVHSHNHYHHIIHHTD